MRWARLSWLLVLLAIAGCGTGSANSSTATPLLSSSRPTLVVSPTALPTPTATTRQSTPTPVRNSAPTEPTPGGQTAAGSRTPTPTPTPTPIVVPTAGQVTTPTPTPFTNVVLDPETRYDGRWVGLTDQGEDVTFELKDGRLLWLNFGFSIPGCEEEGLISREYEDTPFGLDFEGQDSFLVKIQEPYAVSVQLALRQGADSYGLILFSNSNPCGGGFTADIRFAPEGQFVAVLPTPTPIIVGNPKELLPGVELSEELFDRSGGVSHLGGVVVVAEEGDWLVVQSHDSVVPVPKGWTTTTSLQEDTILLFAPGGVEVNGPPGPDQTYSPQPEISVIVNQTLGYDYFSSSEALTALQELIIEPRGGTEFQVLDSQVVDNNRAYVIVAISEFSLPTVHMVLVISNDATEDPLVPVTTAVTFVEVKSEKWEAYWPAIQAILGGWVSASDGRLRGVELPDEPPTGLETPVEEPTAEPPLEETATPSPSPEPSPEP